MPEYTFGDDRAAAERLRLVASAYEPVSRKFLSANAARPVEVALDLGCGPGFTTKLLEEVFGPRKLFGVDSSSSFLELARRRVPRATFCEHDVTTIALPGSPAQVIYARLLLTHLPDPVGTVQRWATQLSPDGVLLVEELEDIDAPPGPLREYDEISADVVRRGGGEMYAGEALAPLGGRSVSVTVKAADAARIYLFNVERWIADPSNPVGKENLRNLEAGLRAILEEQSGGSVSWIVRQLALRE